MIAEIFWDPNPYPFILPFLDRPVAWYGILFAVGFFIGFYFLRALFLKCARKETDWSEELLKKKARLFCERLTMVTVISTVVGARLGHILFYEKWQEYFRHPLEIFKTWEGGLASHGGVIGILVGVVYFYFRSRKEFPFLSILRCVDFLVVPALFVGSLIRVGNFINQEVLGKISNVPWAITFGHPIDGGPALPRHPAQLYESLFYFASFLLFWRLFSRWMSRPGRLTSLFFVWVFSFRFLIEYVKEEQSLIHEGAFLTMGQLLSIPLVILGLALMARKGRVVP